MPAWWNSLETMTAVSSWARLIGVTLGVVAALCAVVVFAAGKQVDALKAAQDKLMREKVKAAVEHQEPRRLTAEQESGLLAILSANEKGDLDLF